MKFICILISFFLVSCASIDKNQSEIISYKDYSNQNNINDFVKLAFSAKITLFVEKKGFTGKIIWNTKNGKSSITILNPFNSVVSKVYLDKSNNSLKISNLSNNKNEIENIIRQIFGSKQNVFILERLIMIPPAQLTSKKNVSLSYLDWEVDYEGVIEKENKIFPKHIELNKNKITLKIYIIKWES
jgi:outer membrane biogenesis lipoprotein LolB